MKTPQTRTVVLAAGQNKTIPVVGKFLHVYSCTVATFQAGFDDDPPQTMYPGITYPASEPFNEVTFNDSGGAGCTIVVIVSDDPIGDARYDSTVLSAIAADLAALELLLEIPDTPTAINQANVTQTGVGENQIVTAGAAKRIIVLQALISNDGDIYLSFVTGVTAANCALSLAPGDVWRETINSNIFVCSANGTEDLRGYEISIS